MAEQYRGRFAPSPTGPLHFGSLVAALASWLDARRAGGAWLVRIEDIDPPREVAGAAEHQLETLAACGLLPDEPPLRQSSRADAYAAALQRLREDGHVYACHCSRSDLQPFGGRHPAFCVGSSQRHSPAWRLRLPDRTIAFDDRAQGPVRQALADEVGDVVVWRSDGLAAYQLAVVVDDAAQGITDVVRGADLLGSTPRQVLLQQLLGLPTPRYLHVPLATDASGAKLSKSSQGPPLDGSDPLPALRAAWSFLGQDPGQMAGTQRLPEWLQHAVGAFDPARIPRRPCLPAVPARDHAGSS